MEWNGIPKGILHLQTMLSTLHPYSHESTYRYMCIHTYKTALSSYFESWCCIGKQIMTMLNALHVKCKGLLHGLFSQTAFPGSKPQTPTEYIYTDHTGAFHLPFSSLPTTKNREYTLFFFMMPTSVRVDDIYCQFSTFHTYFLFLFFFFSSEKWSLNFQRYSY